MSSKQDKLIIDTLFKKAEALGELVAEIRASELPPHIKDEKIEAIETELQKLAKAISSFTRGK